MPTPRTASRSEHGFTIVEIVVAVLILSIILGGVIWMMAGAGKSSQRSDVRQKMSAAANGLAQQVRSNKDWLVADPQCKLRPCSPTPDDKYRYHPKTSSDPKFTSEVVITPIDSPIDNVSNGSGAAADKDHIVPDLYRIAVKISLSPAEQAVWGQQEPFSLVSTIDSTQLGKGTGSLTVQVCKVNNQVDERMAIAGCKERAQQLEMRYQPPCAMDKTMSFVEVEKMVLAGQTLPLSCNAAIAETKDLKREGFAPGSVDVKPLKDAKFTIVPARGTQALERGPEIADLVSGDGAAWTFTGMGTGDYKIDMKVPGGYEVWDSHVVPQDLKVSIQSNQEAKALIILRPKQATVASHYEVALMRNVYVYQLQMVSQLVQNQTPDPIHQAVVTASTTYKYLKFTVRQEPRTGPSWNGYIGMEPKPFDRYRQEGTRTSRQFIKRVGWKAEPVDDPSDAVVVFNSATASPMPTGLYSRPEQLSVTPTGYYGQLDKEVFMRGINMGINKIYDREGVPYPIFKIHLGEGKMICIKAPCGNDYVYLDSAGQPNSSMLFYDMGDGECYVESAVPEVPIVRQLSGGGEQVGTGLPGQDRCERDFTVNGLRIAKMMPDRTGLDGKTVLWRTNMFQWCIPQDQCLPLPDIDRTMIPNPGTIAPSDLGILPTPQRIDSTLLVRSSDAAYAAACGVSLGAGCAAVPPPSIVPNLAANIAMSLIPTPIAPPSAEEQQQTQACNNYNNYVKTFEAKGYTDEQLIYLKCERPCPTSVGAVNDPHPFEEGGASGRVDEQLGVFPDADDPSLPCPPLLSGPSQTFWNPPPAPPVEPPPFTGPNPDGGGVPAIPIGGIPGATPLIPGGLVASNGRTGVQGLCFVAGTQVLMADGAYRSIERIKRGDRVLFGDPKSGRTAAQSVTKLWTRATDEVLVDVTTDDGTFTATAQHPIWNETRDMWWGAFDLTGAELRSHRGSTSLVTRTETHKDHQRRVYNLSLGTGDSSFFIKNGDTDVLVRAEGPNGSMSYVNPT